MSSKECIKCKLEKPLTDYYRHSRMADGHLNKCKVCQKADVTANRGRNIENIREYDRKRGNRQTLEDQHRYREANPKKRAAHVAVGNAIRDGKLVPQPCEVCDSTEVHGHHADYSKPLEVMWLCPVHHKAWHTEYGEGRNA